MAQLSDRFDEQVTLRFRRTATLWRPTRIELPRNIAAWIKLRVREKPKNARL